MFYKQKAIINVDDYNNYIRRYAPKQLNKWIDELDSNEFLDCWVISLSNSHPCYYDNLWLIETSTSYEIIPVLITNINTSSTYTAWSCNIYDDDGEDITLEYLIDFVGLGWRKGLRKVITAEYLEDKKQDSVEDLFNNLSK